ncbi:MAG TPA: class I SAM-dependent methyltransferase [Actinomycetota bacterium]
MTDTSTRTEEFVGRLFTAGLQAWELLTVYIGDKFGLYAALHDDGPATPPDLAARTGVAGRYAQEWLEQQAAAGIVEVEDASAAPQERRYSLPDAHAEALVKPESPYSIAPLAKITGAIAGTLPKLAEAFRTGGGVDWASFGSEAIEAQGDFNRPWLLMSLGSEFLPAVPDVHARLSDTANPARVADVACGAGWAAIAIARAYPHLTVDGFDLDEYSIGLARKNAADAGVADRVTFETRDAADPANRGRYDLAVVIEAIHDLSRPVEVLGAVRAMLAPGGTAIIADERVGEVFTAPADEIDRFMYAASILCCLPAGLSDEPSAATGTVMRPDTLRRYAGEAGFGATTVLDQIEHPMLRFYRLDP